MFTLFIFSFRLLRKWTRKESAFFRNFPIEFSFLSLKIVFFPNVSPCGFVRGKRALFPLTKPQGETLGKKRFSKLCFYIEGMPPRHVNCALCNVFSPISPQYFCSIYFNFSSSVIPERLCLGNSCWSALSGDFSCSSCLHVREREREKGGGGAHITQQREPRSKQLLHPICSVICKFIDKIGKALKQGIWGLEGNVEKDKSKRWAMQTQSSTKHWTQSSTVPHELVLSRSRTRLPSLWPFSALPHFLHLRGFFAAFVASRRGMSNSFPSGPKAPASYVGPSRSTAASSFLAFFCFLFFRCILDSSLVAFSAFRTRSLSAADMAASICGPGTYPSRSNNLFTKMWPSLNILTAMAAAKKTTDGLLNFVFGAIAQIVECRASLLFCVNPLEQRLSDEGLGSTLNDFRKPLPWDTPVKPVYRAGAKRNAQFK